MNTYTIKCQTFRVKRGKLSQTRGYTYTLVMEQETERSCFYDDTCKRLLGIDWGAEWRRHQRPDFPTRTIWRKGNELRVAMLIQGEFLPPRGGKAPIL